MKPSDFGSLLEEGIQALESGNPLAALDCFQKAYEIDPRPEVTSRLAYCLALQQKEMSKATSLCARALREEPRNPLHFLYMGRIYLLAGNKKDAIRIFRKGMGIARTPAIQEELSRLGLRRPPAIPFLSRKNPINKMLGRLISWVKER